MANWIGGYWYARVFGLQYAHSPFGDDKWERFLGFGEGEQIVSHLLKSGGYKKVLLPPFAETTEDIEFIKKIIHSYAGRKVVFLAELP